MKSVFWAGLAAGAVIVASSSSAKAEPSQEGRVGPVAESAPMSDAAVRYESRRDRGIALVVGGSIGTMAGVFGTLATFAANGGSCEFAPCPKPVSPAVQGLVIGGTAAMTGVLATGIVLLATNKRPEAAASARIKPTAQGLAFTF